MTERPVVLFILGGIGLNSSWQGNAFATAKANTINRFFTDYPFEPLSTGNETISLVGRQSDPAYSLRSIGAGNYSSPLYDKINNQIVHHELERNKNLIEACTRAQKHIASLHLFATFSQSDYVSSESHLLEIIKISKKHHRYQAYIHLVLDGSFESAPALLKSLQALKQKLSELKNCQIASIVGAKFTTIKPRSKNLIKTIVRKSPRPRHVLSLEQAVLQIRHFDSATLPPQLITVNAQLVGPVRDFDTVIFVDHNLASLSYWSDYVASGHYLSGQRLPSRSVSYFSLVPQKIAFQREIQPIVVVEENESFPDWKKDNLQPIAAYTEAAAERELMQLMGQSIPEGCRVTLVPSDALIESYKQSYHKTVAAVFSELAGNIAKNRPALSICYLPTLERLAEHSLFAECVDAVKLIDDKLGRLEEKILAENGVMLFTSNLGRSEAVLLDKRAAGFVPPTTNPVPFAIVSNYKNNQSTYSQNTRPVANLVKPKHGIIDILPTLYDVLGVSVPKRLHGTSMLR